MTKTEYNSFESVEEQEKERSQISYISNKHFIYGRIPFEWAENSLIMNSFRLPLSIKLHIIIT